MRNLLVFFIILGFQIMELRAQPLPTAIVDSTKKFPSNAVCQLIVKRKGVKSLWMWNTVNQSTGFYIDSNMLLTNAHNLYSNFWSRVISIEVYRGRNGDVFPFLSDTVLGRKEVKKCVRVCDKYRFMMRAENRARYDYAVAYVNPKEKPDNPLELNFSTSLLFEGRKVQVIGYPGEAKSGKDQYQSTGKYYGETKWNIYYDLFTETGNSGSPVILNNQGETVAVGIHAFTGKGVRISQKVMEDINWWKQELSTPND